jgi:pyruvate dehydrogenase E1 component alpha subunit
VTTSREELLAAFSTMYAIRRMETVSDKMYKQRQIQGFLHLYNGQEAVVTGLEYGITAEDHIITAYRDHGFALTRGDSVLSILAELVGKAAGTSKVSKIKSIKYYILGCINTV